MTAQKRALTLEDLWALKSVSEAQVSPDGKTVAYVVGSHDERTNKFQSAIWLADLEGGQARQFTSGEAADTQPRWSPDGSRLAFVSTRHDGKPQIFVIAVSGGEPRRITTIPQGAHSPVWSPDGTRLCYSSTPDPDRQQVPQEAAWFEAHPDADQDAPRMRRQSTLLSRFDERGYIERRIHLFVLEVDSPNAEPRQLTDGDYDDLEADWSPDGALIAFVSNRTESAEHNFASDVWTVAVEGGELTCLTDGKLSAFGPRWSPDDQTIAFYAAPEPVSGGSFWEANLWTVSRSGGDQRDRSGTLDRYFPLILGDYLFSDPTPPTWSPDGKGIYFLAQDGGDGLVYALDVETGHIRRVSSTGAHVASVQYASGGQMLVCLASTPGHPFDVFAVPSAGGELRPVVGSNGELLDEVTIVPPERVVFQGADDWPIEGWLFKPVNAANLRPYPLILHVHGGPQAAFGNTFYFQAQALAGAGYASLYINPRGSLGYGSSFAQAADWGERDYLDLMAGVDAVLAGGEVDRSRLGVTGLSYGGFMTNWILGHTDRFAAAVSINGISNLVSFFGVSDIAPLWAPTQFAGTFWSSDEAWERYRHHSPITYVENISTPLLLIQSENDYRCPIEQGEQMLSALRVRRQIVELIRIPGASHVIFRTGSPHQRYLERKLAQDWFDTHLKSKQPEVRTEEAGIPVGAGLVGGFRAP